MISPSEVLRRWFRDESAQATTEYILILSVIVSIALLVIRDLVQPILKAFTDHLSKNIEEKMFKPESMHQSPFHP